MPTGSKPIFSKVPGPANHLFLPLAWDHLTGVPAKANQWPYLAHKATPLRAFLASCALFSSVSTIHYLQSQPHHVGTAGPSTLWAFWYQAAGNLVHNQKAKKCSGASHQGPVAEGGFPTSLIKPSVRGLCVTNSVTAWCRALLGRENYRPGEA